MDDPTSIAGLPTAIATAVGIFFGCIAVYDRWRKTQQIDITQVAIITEDRDRWQARAEKYAASMDHYREQLNQIILDQSEMKVQNATMIEQIKTLREENQQLRSEVHQLTGVSNVRSIS